MIERWRASLLLLGAASAGCGPSSADPRPQWKLSIGSDAPIPQFADRLLVEFLDAAGEVCSGCRRALTLRTDGDLPVSIGIVPPADDAQVVRVRARLYRSLLADVGGAPPAGASIDAVATLPPVEGVTDVALPLRMSCFGIDSDPAGRRSCDPAVGALGDETTLSTSLAGLPASGSWPPARDVPCGEAPLGEMVCIPGGAFLLGSPGVAIVHEDYVPFPEQIVQLSPFALDIDEVTVGTLRKYRFAGDITESPNLHVEDIAEKNWACTYLGDDDDANDALPVNCVSQTLAAEACKAMGKRLPTEAEWEYAAGNRDEETLLPWGDYDLELCSYAFVGRGRTTSETMQANENYDCRSEDAHIGLKAGGSELDVTTLGVRNMAGSVSEWVQDAFSPYTSSTCWGGGPTVHVDPICEDTMSSFASVRGASYAHAPGRVRIATRDANVPANDPTTQGFRCARSLKSGTPAEPGN